MRVVKLRVAYVVRLGLELHRIVCLIFSAVVRILLTIKLPRAMIRQETIKPPTLAYMDG